MRDRYRDPVAPTPACTVYHGATTPEAFRDDPTRWRPADELFAMDVEDVPAGALIVDRTMEPRTAELRRLPRHIVLIAADDASERLLERLPHVSVASLRRAGDRRRVLRGACLFACTQLLSTLRRRQLARANRELRELNRIGMSLMVERDLVTLLRRILQIGKRLTESDGGALFLARDTVEPQLIPSDWQIDTLPDLTTPFAVVPVDDTSIVGHAARIRRPVVIDDAYDLPPNVSFVLNRSFDERYGYRRRSMLFVPMVDHRDKLVGVLAFVNRKRDPSATIRTVEDADRWVLPYTKREVGLAQSLAGQAAISIENAKLYAQIERTLESVVEAAVSAIDQRDPTTAGHSLRVAELAVGLAEAVERDGREPYRDVRFSPRELRELRYAALLHDVGKVVVREDVLMKAKKLPPVLWERVNARFDYIARTIELEHCRRGYGATSVAAALAELARIRAIVREANEPTVERVHPPEALRAIAARTYEGPAGQMLPYLTPEELHFLELPQGTLDAHERALVEAHAAATHRFLAGIPWTDDLQQIPAYAYGHHEKLDGTGYPQRLQGDEIPLQTRIITLADMFDALTESDRPYKRAVTPEAALGILQEEADAGRLDRALVDILRERRVYERVLGTDWHQL